MNLSHVAAGRPRRVDGAVFFSENVRHRTPATPTLSQPAAPYAWKRSLEERIWSAEGPRGVSARAVLVTILRHADVAGRTWISISTIAAKAGIGSLRTVRNALDALAREGWLAVTPQTWASLTAEQTAAGRPGPRRMDAGQAPNLYVLRVDQTIPASPVRLPTTRTTVRPGLARIPQPAAVQHERNDQGGPCHNRPGESLSKQPGDLDPFRSGSMKVCGETEARLEEHTHSFLKHRDGERSLADAWRMLVAAHAAKTEARFGLVPSKPDLRPEQQQAMADCLAHAATQVRKKLEQQGILRDVPELQRELAEHVMRHYFKHESEHLKRVKWALRDLGRELDARMIDAMQSLLREERERAKPIPSHPVSKEKPTANPAEFITIAAAAHVDNAREAQRIIAMLEGSTASEIASRGQDKHAVAAHPSLHNTRISERFRAVQS